LTIARCNGMRRGRAPRICGAVRELSVFFACADDLMSQDLMSVGLMSYNRLSPGPWRQNVYASSEREGTALPGARCCCTRI
jgi:hypothetical protein